MTSWLGRVVATGARHPFVVLLLSLGLTATATVYAAGHFAMTTDTATDDNLLHRPHSVQPRQ